ASKGEAKRWFAMGDGRDAPGGVRERLRSPRLALTATGIAGRRKISIRTRLVPCVTIPRRRAAPDETASPSPTDEWTAIGDAKSDRASESDRLTRCPALASTPGVTPPSVEGWTRDRPRQLVDDRCFTPVAA